MVGGMSEYYDQSGCTPSRSHSAISYTDNQSLQLGLVDPDRPVADVVVAGSDPPAGA
jgi:hypothetical protein